ncbi:FG-GAP repeat domain-containing protein [Piscinibacter sakaiensis]|uniref:FG-GAP repeat domain-containing protein n=1 Tax=Piscinibacter sakaiensis TaxID=1547922 RepID=UPI003AB0CA56
MRLPDRPFDAVPGARLLLAMLAGSWLLLAALPPAAAADAAMRGDAIVAAAYLDPVDRYGHFALGKPHEYARVSATTGSGRQLQFELPKELVFEDLQPRIVTLSAGAEPQLLTIVSGRDGGARLMLLRRDGDRLLPAAQSAPVGRSMRWLNPVGVADLDGDGQAEIAAVLTPHIGGTLKVYRQSGDQLIEIAALAGFSNHVYGSAELGLSTPLAVNGRMSLVVPDNARQRLRVVALADGRLVETASCPLDEALTGALQPHSDGRVELVGRAGRRLIDLTSCRR